MQIITGTARFDAGARTAVAIGKFDGVHLGHRRLLEDLAAQKANGLKTCVFTFDPSPEVYFSGAPAKELTTKAEKRKLFAALGVDLLIEFPFNRETAGISPETFIRQVLKGQLHAAYVAAGEDLSFGEGGKGDFSLLTSLAGQYGYRTHMIRKVTWQGEEISSSRIRRYIQEGRMEEAAACLGAPYSIRGTVRHGNAIGRTMQMPTLNLVPEETKLLPPFGVYYSHVFVNSLPDAAPAGGDVSTRAERYEGMTNIGLRPTIRELHKHVTVETYVYRFNRDIYGRDVTIELLTFSRPEQKFDSLAALHRQLRQDMEKGRVYHGL